MAFVQSALDPFYDYVFPIAVSEVDEAEPNARRFVRLAGTGFLIGQRGVALTAAHVIQDGFADLSALFRDDDGTWTGIPFGEAESHPTEDAAAIQLRPQQEAWRPSFISLASSPYGQGSDYRLWGYPDDVLHEVIVDGRSVPRPDLVYVEGYVRRRITGVELPLRRVRGATFLELSDPAGRGCSGAPVLLQRDAASRDGELIGIYVGERESDGVRVGYAVREDVLRDWAPRWLETTIATEATGRR